VRAPIHIVTADTGSHPAVEKHVDARALRVVEKDGSEKDRAEVQKTMLGPNSSIFSGRAEAKVLFLSRR
jgi:hypothetical protein